MKRSSILIAALTLILGLTTTAYANIYATDVAVSADVITTGATNTTVDITFILNEDSDTGVDVNIYSGATLVRTLTMATAAKGPNSITWDGTDAGGATLPDGDYTFEVVASDDGHTEWTKISDPLKTVMYSPKGISVNNNPSSEHFGKVYVSNGYAGTSANAGAFYNGDGVFTFNSIQDSLDFSDGGLDWSNSSNAPGESSVDDNDKVFVTHYGSDLLYSFDPAISSTSAMEVIGSSNKYAGQYISSHFIHGTGTEKSIYTVSEQYAAVDGVTKYTLGTDDVLAADYTGEHVVARPNGSYYQNDVVVDAAGNIYICQKRSSAGQAYPLLKYPPYTGTTLTIADTLWAIPMTSTGATCLALDEVNGHILWGDYYSGAIYIHDMETGAAVDTIITGQNRNNEIVFDAAGNLYSTDNSGEYWNVFSAPDGANSFTTPGRTAITIETPTVASDVLINEFDTNTSTAEYIELFNTTDVAIDLAADGYSLVFYNGNGDAEYQTTALTGSIPANGFFVVAEVGVTDIGGYTPDQNAVWTSFQNGTDAVALLMGTDQVDAVIYGTSADTDLETLLGLPGILIVNEASGSSSRVTDGQGGADYANEDWHTTVARTPGATNEAPPPSFTPYTILEIQTPDAGGDSSQYLGELVETSGIITAMTSYSFYMQNGTADYSGIYIYVNGDVSGYNLGDSVTVQGTVNEYFGLTQISSIYDVTVNASGMPLPEPIVLITNTLSEGHEGMLVSVSGVCTAVSTNAGTDRWAFKVDDGSGDALIDDQIYSDTETAAVVGSTYDVTGVVNFYYGAFTVNPRELLDIEEVIIDNDLNLTFEDDSDGVNWGVYDGATGYTTVTHDPTGGVDGTGAMVFGDGGYAYYIKRPVSATPGTDYVLSVDLKTLGWDNPDSYPITLSIEGLEAEENSVSINSMTEFTNIVLMGTAVNAAGYIKLEGSNTSAANAGGTINVTIDNLMFDDDYEPPPNLDLDLAFEDDVDVANWGVYDGATGYTTVAHDATAGVGGTGAIVFGDGGYGFYIKRPVAATIGTDYTLSIDIKTVGWDNPDSYPITLAIEGLDVAENSISINSLTDFTTITLSGSSTAAAGYIKLAGSNTSAAGAGGTISVTIDNLVFDDNAGASDFDPPDLLSGSALSSTIVELMFNEDMDPVTGGNAANYTIDHGIGAPTAAVVMEDVVTLTLGTAMMFDSTYTVIVNNVADDGGNVLLADTVSFMYTYEFVSDLFFSEYIEGSSSNKALEIYNPTDTTIDLSGYTIGGTSNEATDWEYFYTFPDSALSIPAMSVYVMADASAEQGLQDLADWVTEYPGPTSYNGNDARGLFKIVGLDTILIDAVGDVNNPTAADYAAAGMEDALGEHTLVRKADLIMGNPDWMMSAGTDAASSEWVIFPQNTFRFLGAHPHTDLVGPELAGVVAVSETQIQLRFSEPVVSADALTLANYTITDDLGSEMPTAATMLTESIYVLDVPALVPNTYYTVAAAGIHDLVGNEIMADASIDVMLDIPGSLPIDRIMNDFVDGIGNWAHPTYSGSTSGILAASTFASSDSMAFEGTHSGEMVILDDPAVSGGWFIRLWNINRVDRIDADSKMFFYLYGGNADMQARIVIKDDQGYEAGPWHDITFEEADWQVVSLDLLNDPVQGWITGNGVINASGGSVSIDCIQIRCSEDVSTNLYFDMVTERYNIEPVEVTFDVNMSVQTLMGNFVHGTDALDVAGSFNGWDGAGFELANTVDTLYSITVTNVYPGETLEYKFRINGSWDTSEFPGGGPNRTYVVPDSNSVVFHWYDDVDTYVGVDGMAIPTEYALHDNYPNPFNPITNIKYDIPENTHVTIAIYNTLGQHVIDLVNEEQPAGYYHLQWNGLNKRGTPVGSGLYFYRLTTEGFSQSEKMTYLK